MDESRIKIKVGQPIPEWDGLHRLHVDRPVGPDLWDGGTIFGFNSTYMDVTEQPFMERQWAALGAVLSLSGIVAAWWGYHLMHTPDGEALSSGTHITFYVICLVMIIAFGRLAYLAGHTVFFALKNRPIRFNRKERKIFAVRRRRFFLKEGEGDVVTEVDWDKNSVFCIHRTITNFGRVYHVRCYKLDAQGNVLDAFSIGREWEGDRNVRTLLAQWNYWCKYMNEGPQNLPKPMLFLPTRETTSDTFFFAMYTFGMIASGTARVITMPFTLVFMALRALSLATCRHPIWPDSLTEANRVDPCDAFAQPSKDTPVGWAQTIRAQLRGEYPESPRGTVPGWSGLKDGVANAELWVKDKPPGSLAGA
jgi:hypothetical protein